MGGDDTTAPNDDEETAKKFKQWRRKTLRHNLFWSEQFLMVCLIILCVVNLQKIFGKFLTDYWTCKKDVAYLQLLENNFANTKQGDHPMGQFFKKIKNLCSEISKIKCSNQTNENEVCTGQYSTANKNDNQACSLYRWEFC